MRFPLNVLCAAAIVHGVLIGRASAQTSFPMITHATPVALQRGKTTEVVVDGQMNFFGAYKVLFEGSGVSAEVVPEPAPKTKPPQKPRASRTKIKVTVNAEAALGIREFRIASSLGISSVGQIVLVDQPVVLEQSKNKTLAEAHALALPCAVSGRLEAVEDVDFYKFQGEAGQTVTFELFCARLQDKIHDLQKHAKPMLVLQGGEGRELAANDHFYFADPLLSFTIPKTGTYYLQVRDSTYDGDPRWAYALLATNRPYVSHVFPMAGNAGQVVEVEPVGSARAVSSRVKLQTPREPGVHLVQLDVGNGVKTNPVAFLVSPLPQVMEQEPNDTEATATRVTIPCGINGRIGKRRDLDHFVFAAKKGQAIHFQVRARHFGTPLTSSLHAVLEVRDAKGTVLASNDTTHGQEASLVFAPPADGDFILRIRDLNSKGGDTAVYYIEADFARPDFSLRCDPDKAMIGPGSSTAWYVHVTRTSGFAGPVKVDIKGLPDGVSASPLTIPPTMTQGLVVLTAAANARQGAALVDVFGTATVKDMAGKEQSLTRRATPNEEIYSPGGGRAIFDVCTQAVAVTDPSDILKVEVKPQRVTLKPGEEVKVDVTIQRRPDYTKDVSLDVQLQHLGQVFGNPLPPGVTVDGGKSKTLLGPGSQGHVVLKAAANAAPIEDVPISVLAHVSINFVVKVSYSSPPLPVSVRKQ
jgi:hypothetical protein